MIHAAGPLGRAADEQRHADTTVHSMPWGRGGRPDTPIVSNPRPMLCPISSSKAARARLTIQFTYHFWARSDYRKVRSGRPRKQREITPCTREVMLLFEGPSGELDLRNYKIYNVACRRRRRPVRQILLRIHIALCRISYLRKAVQVVTPWIPKKASASGALVLVSTLLAGLRTVLGGGSLKVGE
jgi:hypothetical protein